MKVRYSTFMRYGAGRQRRTAAAELSVTFALTPVPTILCIDDHRDALELCAAFLASEGYTVFTAPDGPSGIAFTRSHAIDAVVLDYNMPNMDGAEVAQILRLEDPALRVVVWSVCLETIPESSKWFADVLLEKGDSPDCFLSSIAKLLHESALGNTASQSNRNYS
jgi:CheY-like chemotaxis protein